MPTQKENNLTVGRDGEGEGWGGLVGGGGVGEECLINFCQMG